MELVYNTRRKAAPDHRLPGKRWGYGAAHVRQLVLEERNN